MPVWRMRGWLEMRTLLHGFRNLTRFSGRDGLAAFWLHVALVMGLAFLGTAVATVPTMMDSMARMQRFAAEHPDQARVEQTPTSYSIQIQGDHPELMPNMAGAVTGVGVVAIVVVLLLAAAVTRRLHDSGLRGAWGLMPLPFLTFGLIEIAQAMGRAGGPEMQLFLLVFVNNLIYLFLLIVLVVLLVRSSTPGPNRFGAPPTD